jgi:hypothetical protein
LDSFGNSSIYLGRKINEKRSHLKAENSARTENMKKWKNECSLHCEERSKHAIGACESRRKTNTAKDTAIDMTTSTSTNTSTGMRLLTSTNSIASNIYILCYFYSTF